MAAGDGYQPDLIYDVGLHLGEDSAYYLRSGYRVVAIEANPVLAEHATRRFGEALAAGRLTILSAGIASGEGSGVFWVCDDRPEWSSFDRSVAARNGARHHAIEVPLLPFADVLAEHGVPLYCKVDIEGNDGLCLEAITPRSRPAFASVELSDRPLLEQFERLGYDRFKLVHQLSFSPPSRLRYALRRRLPRRLGPALERCAGELRGRRRDAGWRFPIGSSGPVPTRLAGPWLDDDGIRRALRYVAGEWEGGELGLDDWFDLHATTGAALAAQSRH